MSGCSGPCLQHCYGSNNIIYLIMCFIIGVIVGIIVINSKIIKL